MHPRAELCMTVVHVPKLTTYEPFTNEVPTTLPRQGRGTFVGSFNYYITVMSLHSDYTQRKRVAACLFTALCTLKSIKVRRAASSDALALRVVAMCGHHGNTCLRQKIHFLIK